MNLKGSNELNFLFADMNSFFASCEQQDKPDLRGEPIIVVPSDTDSTCAIAASIEAKQYGIRTGTKVYEAKRMCPRLRCIPASHQIYAAYHHKLLAAFDTLIPVRRVWSIDEWDCQLQGVQKTPDGARNLALALKQRSREMAGEWLRMSIGIAPNSFLAKVATDMEKPDGLVVLEHDMITERLFRMKLRDLPGIGPSMEWRLKRAGIFTIEDLWHCPPKRARAIWHNVGGEKFWYNLHGVIIPEQETERSVFGHSRILDPVHRAPEAAYQITRRLTAKAVQRMQREGYMTTWLGLSIRSPTRQQWHWDYHLPLTDDLLTILRALERLWRGEAAAHIPPRLLQVSISLSGLTARTAATGDPFEYSAKCAAVKMRPGIDQVITRINRKFGPQTINLGLIPPLNGAPIGTKIAFSRVPDMDEFHE